MEAMQHLSEHFFVQQIFYELIDVVTSQPSPCVYIHIYIYVRVATDNFSFFFFSPKFNRPVKYVSFLC